MIHWDFYEVTDCRTEIPTQSRGMRAESEESREVGRSRGVVAACVRLEKACPTCGAKNRISSGYWSPLMRESPSRSSSSAASSSACGFYFAFSSASNLRSNCMPFLIPRRIALALRDQLFVTCDVFVVHEWLHFNRGKAWNASLSRHWTPAPTGRYRDIIR